MQLFFHQLLSWADQNGMVLSLTKTKEMVLGPPSITSNLPPISTSSYQIQRASEAKLLDEVTRYEDRLCLLRRSASVANHLPVGS